MQSMNTTKSQHGRNWTMTFWVFNASGEIVTNYANKSAAVAHAARIGGTWKRGRL